jgi:hypothetical protein
LHRDEDESQADIRGGIKNLYSAIPKQLKQPHVLLTAAAPQTDDMDPSISDSRRDGFETFSVAGGAVGFSARRRVSLVESQPSLGLFDAVIVKFVVDLSEAQRFQ